MEKFKFTPESGFRDGTAYPNPTSEANTREMFQRPLDQLRDYVNQLLGIIPTDEQLQQMVTNHDLILELEKAVKELEENSNSYAEYDEETGNLQINSAMDILALFKQLSNPNLLINSDFRNPINQRGQTSYWKPSSYTYSIDRWTHIWNSVILEDDCIWIYNDTGETGTTYFKQIFEYPLEQGDYTVTVNVKEVNGTVYVNDFGTLSKGLNVFTVNNTSLPQLQLNLVGVSGIRLHYIKLEQGSIATPFVPRLYDEELALCQRYYQAIAGFANSFPIRGDNNYVHVFLSGVMMRKNPNIIGGNIQYAGIINSSIVAPQTSSTVVGAYRRGSGLEIAFAKATNTVNYGIAVITSKIELDAEIY